MSEKVFGFKTEINLFLWEQQGKTNYLEVTLRDGKLCMLEVVPVVSLEWLEKYCKENGYRLLDDNTLEHTGKPQDTLLLKSELLLAAKKESEKSER